MIKVLFFNVLFLQKTLYIDLVRLIKLILLFLFDILIDDVVYLLVCHVILFNFVGYFVKDTFMQNSYSKECLLKLFIAQTCEIIICDVLVLC
jgi:hypothetical protein